MDQPFDSGGSGAGAAPPQAAEDPEHAQQRRWLLEVWSYTAFMAVALSIVVLLLTGGLLLAIPVVAVCLVAGAVGTTLAFQRSRAKLNEHSQYESIFR